MFVGLKFSLCRLNSVVLLVLVMNSCWLIGRLLFSYLVLCFRCVVLLLCLMVFV